MIGLRDTVEIKASPEQIFQWLAHFKENYLAWHPDHVKGCYLKGEGEEGSLLYCEEYLHGKLHKFKFRITKVKPGRIDYNSSFGTGGAFIIEPRGANSLFTAEIYMGTKASLLDKLCWISFCGCS